jgi:hypothetical protein
MTSEIVPREDSARLSLPLKLQRADTVAALDLPFMPAQGWVKLGAERERTLERHERERRARLQRLVLLPVMVFGGVLSVVGLILLGGAVLTLGIATGIVFVFAGMVRLPLTRAWVEQERQLRLEQEAIRWRTRAVALLREEQRHELAQLSRLVENIRAYTRLPSGATVPTNVVERLDRLLLGFVDRAADLRTATAASAATEADAPSFPSPLDDEPDGRLRILGLRSEAREACRNRIEALRRELAITSDVVRLLHEQTFAAAFPHDDLGDLVEDLLDDAQAACDARSDAERTAGTARRGCVRAFADDAA